MTFTKVWSWQERACCTCMHYRESHASREEGGYLEERTCEQNPKYGNLNSFPFRKKKPCHEIEFWHSRFTDLLKGDLAHDERVFALFQESDPEGKLTPELEVQFQELLKAKEKFTDENIRPEVS